MIPPTFIAKAALALLAAALFALVFRDGAHVFATPLTEDSYYSLAAARAFAEGRGFTIDGLQPTNGFQPLFTVFEAGCFWLARGDAALALRYTFGLSWLVWLGATLLVGLIARDAETAGGLGRDYGRAGARGWLAALLFGGGHLTVMHYFNGLETGLAVFGWAALIRAVQTDVPDRPLGPALLGIGLGLLVLTRIDAAILTAIFCLHRLGVETRARGLARALPRVLLMGSLALAVSSPWWIYNWTTFGALMPTSGAALQSWGLDERRWRWIFWALGVSGLPGLWMGRLDESFHDGLIWSVLRGVLAFGLLILLTRRSLSGELRLTSGTRRGLGLALAALAVMILYYGFGFSPFWFYYRYLFPFSVVAAVVLGCLLAPDLARRPLFAALLMLGWVAQAGTTALMAQQGRTLHVETVYWGQLALIDAHVPPHDVVAAGQAGTLGFFRPATLNVDGKVNREAAQWTGPGWAYLEHKGVRWFCDWSFYVERHLGADPAAQGWREVARDGEWRLFHRAEQPAAPAEQPAGKPTE